MSHAETELEMVERHVREGKRHLTSQRGVLLRLKRHGHPTQTAEELLINLEDMQRLHLEHLARLRLSASGKADAGRTTARAGPEQ